MISGSIGEYKDKDSVSPSVSPASIQHVAIGECLISRPLLFPIDPGSGENVSIYKIVRAGTLSFIILEIPNVFISSILARSPPKLPIALLIMEFKNWGEGGVDWSMSKK